MKFCKVDDQSSALKMSIVAGHWKLKMTNWELSSKLILLQLHEKLPRNSASTILQPFGIWHKLERCKSSISGLTTNQINHCLEVSSYSAQQRWTVSWSGCDMRWKVDCIWQPDCIWPAQWLDWEEAPKHFPNSNFQKKMSWLLFGGLLPVWSITAFWIPADPLHLRSTLSKSVRCTALKTARSAASIGQRKGPSSPWQGLTTQPML